MKKTKKLLSVVLAALMLLMCAPLAFAADTSGVCGENLTWTLDENGVLTISGTGEMADFSGDPSYSGRPWEDSLEVIKSVVIEDGVTSIYEGAFGGCTNLETVSLPDSMKSIGNAAFGECMKLQSVTIPSGVESIGYSPFAACLALESIDVDPENEKYMSIDGALLDKDNMEIISYPCAKAAVSYDIPRGVESVGFMAFFACPAESITIPDTVKNIGYMAFGLCENLKEIVIPDSVAAMDMYTFYGCHRLESVVLSNRLKEIGMCSFIECMNIKSISIPSSVKKIGEAAFVYCIGLEDVTIPKGVESIGDGAFAGCNSLKSVTVPGSVTEIGEQAFGYAIDLDEESETAGDLFLDPDFIINGKAGSAAEAYAKDNGIKFVPEECTTVAAGTCGDNLTWKLESDGVLTISGTGKMVTMIVIQENETVSRIETPWTAYRNLITDVIIEDGATNIGERAFYRCNNLERIQIPDSVTSIGEQAFYRCTSLSGIDIPDSVTSIGGLSFYHCTSLKSFSISKNVTSLSYGRDGEDYDLGICDSFYDCTALESIDVDPENKYYSSIDGVLFTKDGSRLLAYPGGIKSEEYTVPDTVKALSSYEFYDNLFLKSITIPAGVARIAEGCFERCKNLESINVAPENPSYTSADGILYDKNTEVLHTFPKNNRVENFIIPDSVKRILPATFQDCQTIKSVTIPKSVQSVDNGAFYDCPSLEKINVDPENEYYKSVDGVLFSKDETVLVSYPNKRADVYTVPETVTSIGSVAFFGCTDLKKVTIPGNVKDIGTAAFMDCCALEDVIISDGVSEIMEDAFAFTAMKSVTVPSSVTEINAFAFGVYYDTDGEECIDPEFIIYSHLGTAAEEYANTCSVTFEHIRPYVLTETIAPTCLEDGKNIYSCDCGFVYEEKIPANGGHVFGEWYTTKEPTVFVNGEEERACEVCGFKETRELGRTEIPDPDSGIHIIFPDHTFDDEVQVTANHINNADIYDKIEEFDTTHISVLDVNAYRDGEKVQPNGKVWIKVPAPEWFDEKNCSAYYLPETGRPERVQSYYADGYVYIETTHFSYYAIVDDGGASSETPENPSENCSCICHQGGFMGFIYKIFRFFWKIFGINKTCECGVNHY